MIDTFQVTCTENSHLGTYTRTNAELPLESFRRDTSALPDNISIQEKKSKIKMPVKAIPAEDADFERIFEITSLAFDRNEPVWDAMWPSHWLPQGRQQGAERMRKTKNTTPETTFIKAIDTETGKILGMAKWNIFQNYSPSRSEVPDIYENNQDRDYAQGVVDAFLATRNQAIKERDGNVIALDILTVDPAYQRQKVGSCLVEWGTRKADEMGFDAIVESSVFGRGLYEKHGFEYQNDVQVTVPGYENDASRPTGSFAWMVRPKTTKA